MFSISFCHVQQTTLEVGDVRVKHCTLHAHVWIVHAQALARAFTFTLHCRFIGTPVANTGTDLSPCGMHPSQEPRVDWIAHTTWGRNRKGGHLLFVSSSVPRRRVPSVVPGSTHPKGFARWNHAENNCGDGAGVATGTCISDGQRWGASCQLL